MKEKTFQQGFNRLSEKRINFWIKLIIILLLVLSLYWKIGIRENVADLWLAFKTSLTSGSWYWLVITFILMPVNWSLETLKWQRFIRNRVGFFEALKATLAGVTISLFTPNRVGDYGGRVILVKSENNWATVVATMAGNYCQFMILLTGGVIGVLYFGQRFLVDEWTQLSNLILILIVFLLMLWLVPFTVSKWERLLKRYEQKRWVGHLVSGIMRLKEVGPDIFLTALLLALLRYLTFSFQYFFILQFYGVKLELLDALSGIATIFLIQVMMPLPPVAAILARGQIALTVWEPFQENAISILAATFSLFIINLVIPAFLGLLFIIKTNTLKSLGYENHAN